MLLLSDVSIARSQSTSGCVTHPYTFLLACRQPTCCAASTHIGLEKGLLSKQRPSALSLSPNSPRVCRFVLEQYIDVTLCIELQLAVSRSQHEDVPPRLCLDALAWVPPVSTVFLTRMQTLCRPHALKGLFLISPCCACVLTLTHATCRPSGNRSHASCIMDLNLLRATFCQLRHHYRRHQPLCPCLAKAPRVCPLSWGRYQQCPTWPTGSSLDTHLNT